MKRHRAPAAHQPKKLWLPSDADAQQDAEEGPSRSLAAAGGSGRVDEGSEEEKEEEEREEEEEDDLDRLLGQYEAQAALDLEAVRSREQERQQRAPGQRGATQRREAALEQPLAADNKGFRMLAAMGYQPGRGLGKSVEGRAEPLPLDLKQDRLGLGRVSKRAAAREAQRERERQAAERVRQAQHEAEASIHAGRQRTAQQFAARREAAQLRKAQQVCGALDTAAGITANHLWQPPLDSEAAGTEAAAQPQPLDRAAAARQGPPHAHAVCGGRGGGSGGPPDGARLGGLLGADDEELLEGAELHRRDLTGPGQEEEDRAEERRYAGSDAAAEKQRGRPAGGRPQPAASAEGDVLPPDEHAAWHQLPVQEQLRDVLTYLRERHCYCIYCGCRYEDAADLYSNCPGMLEADHE